VTAVGALYLAGRHLTFRELAARANADAPPSAEPLR
jgi:hypothetical protein